MSIFVIGDLHLSFGTDKPMDIFGWENHVEKIKQNWIENVTEQDTVVIPGDFSWAMTLDEAYKDFEFLALKDGTYMLMTYTGNAENLVLPSKYKNELVTQTNGLLFDKLETLQKVTLPDSITYIGGYTFYRCPNLKEVDLGKCVQLDHLELYTIFDCKNLTKVTLPASLTYIADHAFLDCDNLQDIYFLGTEEQWYELIAGSRNEEIARATVHFKN